MTFAVLTVFAVLRVFAVFALFAVFGIFLADDSRVSRFVRQLQIGLKPFQLFELKVDTKYRFVPLFTVEDFSGDLKHICMKFAILTNVCLTEALSSWDEP